MVDACGAEMRKLGVPLPRSGVSSEPWRLYAGVVWRGVLLGCALYLALGDDPVRNLRYNLISYIIAIVWCYYDGIGASRRWSTAWYEGLLLHLIGIVVGKVLILAFGSPLL